MGPRPKSYQKHSPNQLQKAVSLVKKGKSLRCAASETGIPFNTIKDHAHGKYSQTNAKLRGTHTLSFEEEQYLVNYIKYMNSSGFPLGRKVIKKLTIDIIKSTGKQTGLNPEKGPSNKWIRHFMSRHKDLSLRAPHPLEQSRSDLTSVQINDYFQLLKDTLSKLGIADEPSQIFNLDETGFSGKEFCKEKVVVPKETKHPYQPSVGIPGHITLNLAISASGKSIAPLMIFSKCKPSECYRDGLSQEWSFECAESAYINNDIFSKWFEEEFVPQCGRARPVLVIMDNHNSHITKRVIDTAKANNIHLLCLPAHSTHLIQPLDVGVFHLLKSNVAKMCTSLGYTGMKTNPRHKFPKLVHLALNKIAPANISASFSAAGISPFDAHKVVIPLVDREKVSSEDTVDVAQNDSPLPLCKCGKSKDENVLVQLGLISEELEFVLREPPKLKLKPSGNRKPVCKNARVITDDVVECGEATPVAVDRKSNKKCKTSKKVQKEKTVDVVDVPESDGDSPTLCEVCTTGTNSLTWFGCDDCTRWVHYECLPHDEQVQLDLSCITGAPWLCNSCRSEQ